MAPTFLVSDPSGAGFGYFRADRFVSVLLLDGQRDDGNLGQLLPPLGTFLLDKHLGDPGRGHTGTEGGGGTARSVISQMNAATSTGFSHYYV